MEQQQIVVVKEPELDKQQRPSLTNSSVEEIGIKFNGRGRQFYAAIAANMSAAALGTVQSWTATALPDLRKTTKFSFTTGQENWIGPIALLGAVVACPIAGKLIEFIGRRNSLLYLNGPFVLGYGLIAFAQNIEMIYLGRFITGFCGGCFSIAAPVLITEISAPNLRGCFTSLFDMMITVGILYIFLIGSVTSWEIQALACGAIAIVCNILMLFVPESPIFLVQKGRMQEAKKSLAWFAGVNLKATTESTTTEAPSEKIDIELSNLQRSIEESRTQKAQGSLVNFFTSGSVLKPMGIGIALMFFSQMSGIDPILFYIVDIFESTGTNVNENVSTIIVGTVQVVATIISALVVDRCGRRFLLLISDAFMVISLVGLGTFFYLKKHNYSDLSWLPLTSLMIYVIAYSVGYGPIPWLMVNEIAPTEVKGTVSGIVTITRWLLGFIISLFFKDIMACFGNDGGYWFFGGFCFFGVIFVYFLVPETKGKTLEEIQKYFNPSLKTQNVADNIKQRGSHCSETEFNGIKA